MSSSYGNLCMSICSEKSNGSTLSLNSHVESAPSVVSCKEQTTLVSRSFTYKWHLVGYPFATTTVRSEDFAPPDCSGDTWYLQLEPPKLRVEKGSNVDLSALGTVSYSTVYSTSASDMQSISPPPPMRFAASGFEYFTDCRLSLLLRKRGDRSSNPVTASFEIGLASDCRPDEPLQTWVAFAESFTPFSDFPSKVISMRGKISDLVQTHKLTRLTITCQLFYSSNSNNQKEGIQISNIKLNSTNEFLFNGRNSERGNYYEDLSSSPVSSAATGTAFEEKNSLLSDLRKLFSDPKGRKLGADVAFVGVDGAIEAHRVILIARSPVFREAFESEISRSGGESSPQIKVYGVPLKVLRPFVNFLYTDQVASEELAGISVELLLLADKYKIPKLRLLCEHSVARGLSEDNFADVVALSRTIKSSVIQRRLHEFFR